MKAKVSNSTSFFPTSTWETHTRHAQYLLARRITVIYFRVNTDTESEALKNIVRIV